MAGNRREFLQMTAASLASICALPLMAVDEARKPNIVIILADDYGYGDVGCYGSDRFKTPNIDAIAADGIRFTDFHSNGAVCSPTRAALLTGKYQQRTGINGVVTAARHRHTGLDPKEITFAEIARTAGYKTAIFGKWHVGYAPKFNPVQQGFDEFIGFVSGNIDYHAHIDQEGYADWWKQDELKSEEGYTTDLITEHGVDFIRRNKDNPFLLYLPHEAPHYPYQGRDDPQLYELGVGKKQMPITLDAYKEMIEVMDEGIGRIRRTLVDLGIDGNTFIFFMSDNGPSGRMGSSGPLRGNKGKIYEGGHRVPAVCAWPGKIEAGQISDLTAMGADLFPTMAAIMGVDLPQNLKLDGINLLPYLLTGHEPPPRSLFWGVRDKLAVRRGDYKLISDKSFSNAELYNLGSDLGEKKDIAAEYPEVVEEMMKILKHWHEDVNRGVHKRSG